MKKFLSSIVLFSIGVLCLLALAESMARHCPNAYSIKEEWMQQHADEIETLVLGSSHAYAGVKPEALTTKAYNLANSNQTQRYDWLLLSRDTMTLQHLRTIVYPVSSLLMNYPLEETPEWYRCIYYQLYHHLPVHPDFSRYGFEVCSIQTCCWKVQSLFLSGASDRMCDDYGWCTYYMAKDDNSEELNSRNLSSRLDKYDERLSSIFEEEAYFDQLADLCHRQGWRLLLLGTPVSPLFRSDARGQQQLAQMQQLASEAIARHPFVEYRDYSSDVRFGDADFFDVDHLNDVGATRFTTIIAEDFDL